MTTEKSWTLWFPKQFKCSSVTINLYRIAQNYFLDIFWTFWFSVFSAKKTIQIETNLAKEKIEAEIFRFDRKFIPVYSSENNSDRNATTIPSSWWFGLLISLEFDVVLFIECVYLEVVCCEMWQKRSVTKIPANIYGASIAMERSVIHISEVNYPHLIRWISSRLLNLHIKY